MPENQRDWATFRWDLAAQLRSKPKTPGTFSEELLRLLGERRPGWDWRSTADVARTSGIDVADPEIVAAFALALTKDDPPERVLDAWAGVGVTLGALVTDDRVKSALAIEINSSVLELGMRLAPSNKIEWRLGDAADVLREPIGEFDLVVGSPPIGVKPTQGVGLGPRGKLVHPTLVQAASVVGPNGAMLIVLPESFFGPLEKPVRDGLAEAGLYPSAALALPSRFFAASIPMTLVFMTRVEHHSLFVGELDPGVDLAAIVSNLRSRRAGSLPQLGHLVPAAEFRSWRSMLKAEELDATARSTGLEWVALTDVCTEFHGPRRNGESFDNHPNAIYLPKVGTSSAVASPDLFEIKPQNYLQLVVRPEVADPDFLAAFLSTQLGRKLREQLATGTVIPQISLASLRSGRILLPPTMDQQRSAVAASRKLRTIQQSVTALEARLWQHPLQARRVEAELRTLLQGDGMERWMETLPFPLASVLWRYHAETDAERKCEYLVHFFEATVIFLVDLLLSALQADPQVLADAGRERASAASYTRGSIGIWADLFTRLAKRTRELTGGQPDLARELFGVGDLGRISALTAKSMAEAFRDEAAPYRRDWVGHAAVVGEAEWGRRLSQAEATLGRVQTAIGDAFDGWDLIRAGRGANRGGLITTSIERLAGSRSLFRRGTVELRTWPEDGALYMLETGASLPLRLGPLFTLQRSPESVEDACYFYDRIVDGSVRWISYHFEPVPEVMQPNADVEALIADLDRLG